MQTNGRRRAHRLQLRRGQHPGRPGQAAGPALHPAGQPRSEGGARRRCSAKAKRPVRARQARGIGQTQDQHLHRGRLPRRRRLHRHGQRAVRRRPRTLAGARTASPTTRPPATSSARWASPPRAWRWSTSYAAAAKNGCAVKDRRFVGLATDGTEGYEASCQDGKGYIYKVSRRRRSPRPGLRQGAGSAAARSPTPAQATDRAGRPLHQARQERRLELRRSSKYAVFPAARRRRGGRAGLRRRQRRHRHVPGHRQGRGAGLRPRPGRRLQVQRWARPTTRRLTADLRKFDKKDCMVSNARPAAEDGQGHDPAWKWPAPTACRAT